MGMYGRVFAGIYNRLWAGFANQTAPRIEEFYAATPIGQADKTVLDVCCGTGQLVRHFLDQGYRAVGLDRSAEMLEYARENAGAYLASGQARFVRADAADFAVDERFGLVTSTFDALNHLPDADALGRCFRCVHAVLADGGYFVFDLNTRLGLLRWNSLSVEETSDMVLIMHGIYGAEGERAVVRIAGFIQVAGGQYERFEETVFNTAFDMAHVRELLLAAGFRDAYFAHSQDLVTPLADPEAESRVFIVACK